MHAFYDNSILALWCAWSVYWLAAAIGTKPTRRRESIASRLTHFVPLILGTAIMTWRPAANSWVTLRFLPRTLACFWIGFVLVLLGIAITVLARVWLGGNWSGTVTLKQDHELVRSGPYRFTRHPIYTGLLVALLGSAIAMGEWRGLFGVALITLAFVHKIGIEERYLGEHFGDVYARYRVEVPALIPFWR